MAAQFARAPHRGATSGPTQGAPNAALLIDFDNVTMGIRSDLSKELKHLLNSDIIKGKVAVQRAYADWRRYPQYIVPLAEASVDLIFAPAYGSSKKNATDIRLAIDALELVFTRPEIGTFILLSGDSDFSSLVLKLKEYGKYVIGVGIRESASDLLVQNCDEYYSYSVLSGLTKESDEAGERPDPWTLVRDAVSQMADQSDVMRSDRLKQVMLQLDPNFNEKDLGYSKFSKFLSDAVARRCLTLKKLENGQWEVAPVGEAKAEAETEAPPEAKAEKSSREDGRRSRGRGRDRSSSKREESAEVKVEKVEARAEKIEARAEKAEVEAGRASDEASGDPLKAAYDLLCRAVAEVAGSAGAAARDSDVKRRMLEFEPDWDESTLGFSKFSRFLRQAHDAEVIDLRKTGNGAYEVVLPAGRSSGADSESRGRRSSRTSSRSTRSERPKAEAGDESAKKTESPQTKKPAAEAKKTESAEAKKPESVEAKKTESVEAKKTESVEAKKPAGEAGKPAESTATEAAGEAATSSGAGRGEARPRALGIGFRRGTRGRNMPAGPPPVLPGQTVNLPGTENGKAEPAPEARETKAAQAETAKSEERSTEKPRRTRKSSRSKKTAKAEDKATGKPSAAVAAAPEIAGLPTDAAGVATYLSSRYKGVGKKTAEAVIEAFGADGVFRALHEQPERVREVLGRRAATLLNAWQADLEHRRAEAAAVVEEAVPAADAKSEADEKVDAKAEAKSDSSSSGRKSRSGSRRGRGSSRKKASAKKDAEAVEAKAGDADSRAGEPEAEKAEADAGSAATDEGQKKSGGRSRGRRGGRKRNKSKVAAGGD